MVPKSGGFLRTKEGLVAFGTKTKIREFGPYKEVIQPKITVKVT
jgi:hypothetical protein